MAGGGSIAALCCLPFLLPDSGEHRPGTPATTATQVANRSTELAKARRSCIRADLDEFVGAQQELANRGGNAEDWRVLAESYLERALALGNRRGMAVGRPVFSDLPQEMRQDLDRADAALLRARALGDASSESYRLEAALRGCRITGVITAWRHQSAARSALKTAMRLDPGNPRARIARACRWLFTPIGNDPAAAERELLAATSDLPLDERPLLIAGLAAAEQGEWSRALHHVRRATALNPANPYAVAVEARLEAAESDAFGRDLDDE